MPLPRRLGGAGGRSLLQWAALANFGVGAGVEAAQRATNAGGAAAQLLNFVGEEGIGMRQPFGALPAPGGLEVLATLGPAALPGPAVQNFAYIPGQIQGIADTVGPMLAPGLLGLAGLNAASLAAVAGAAGLGGEPLILLDAAMQAVLCVTMLCARCCTH